jgi:hypothetical protein
VLDPLIDERGQSGVCSDRIATIEDSRLVVLVLGVGHRRDVYVR